MFIEITGEDGSIDQVDLDRDDVEDALAETLGEDSAVTGAGAGLAAAGVPTWNLDVELRTDAPHAAVITRLATTLVQLGLGAARIRPEGREPRPATDLIA